MDNNKKNRRPNLFKQLKSAVTLINQTALQFTVGNIYSTEKLTQDVANQAKLLQNIANNLTMIQRLFQDSREGAS